MTTRLAPSLAAIAAATLAMTAGASAEDLEISGVGISRDLACADGQSVVIAGADHKIVLEGRCGTVTVQGTGHALSFETADSLVVSGAENAIDGGTTGALRVEVTDNRVKTTVGPAGTGRIDVSGADQTLELALAGPTRLTVKGSGHKVTWTAEPGVKAPSVSASGIDNAIRRR